MRRLSALLGARLGIEIEILIAPGKTSLVALRSHAVDAVCMIGEYSAPDTDCISIGSLPTGVGMTATHPLASKKTVRLADLEPYPVMWSESFDSFNRSICTIYSERGLTAPIVRIAEDGTPTPRTGKILRSKALGFSVENGGQPLLADGLILLTTVDAGLVALDRKCLEERWRLPVGEGLAFSAPYSHSPMRPIQGSAIRAGDAVIVAASDGCVHAADLVTGKRLWRRRLGAPLLGTPLAHGGRLYVADLLGTLHCLPLE